MPSWLKPFAWCVKWAALLVMLGIVLWLVQHIALLILALALGGMIVFPVMGAWEAWTERKWRHERNTHRR